MIDAVHRTSIALAAVATFALPSGRVVDQTFSCATSLQGQRPVLLLWGNVRTKLSPVASMQVLPAGVTILHGTWSLPTAELSFAAAKSSLAVDPAACLSSHRPVPLAAAGLPANTPITPTFLGNLRQSCIVADRARADRALLHIRLELADGVATRAQLAIRDAVTGEPVAYVIWTPTRILSFLSPTCSPIE
jgi:hypothetical protein